MPTVPDIHRRGTRAAQASLTVLTVGTLYFVTNEGVTERWNGTTWDPYSAGGSGGSGGTGALLFAWTVNDGSVAAVVGPYLAAPRAGGVSALKYVVKAAGLANLVFDVKQNGTTILSAPVTVLPAVTLGAVNTVALATVPTPVVFDDVFTLAITSGSSAWNLQVQVET